MTSEEKEHLGLFRRAAAQVREASLIAEGRQILIQPRIHPNGSEHVELHLLEQEPFRSLALSIRLAYLNDEPAQFFHICNILYRDGSPEMKERVSDIRARFAAALKHPLGWITVPDGDSRRTYSPKDVIETWMYGVVFHQDPERQADLRALEQAEAHFRLAVQSTALLLAGRILDLDDQIADFLHEPRLPRIPPRAQRVADA